MIRVTKVTRKRLSRVSQGDIYRDVQFVEHARESEGIIEISRILFPLVVVLTQDCDLEQDFGNRQIQKDNAQLLSVLVAPVYNAQQVYNGEHLTDLDLAVSAVPKSGTAGDTLRNNQTPRYHYLVFPDEIPLVPSVIDFKHYFSVNVKYLESVKSKQFVCRVAALFREDIAHRFSAFLSRIGLPDRAEPALVSGQETTT